MKSLSGDFELKIKKTKSTKYLGLAHAKRGHCWEGPRRRNIPDEAANGSRKRGPERRTLMLKDRRFLEKHKNSK
jgi:hypothetical protein